MVPVRPVVRQHSETSCRLSARPAAPGPGFLVYSLMHHCPSSETEADKLNADDMKAVGLRTQREGGVMSRHGEIRARQILPE